MFKSDVLTNSMHQGIDPFHADNDQLLVTLCRLLESFDHTAGALFLIAYEVLPFYFSVFLAALKAANDYPNTLEGLVAYLGATHAKIVGVTAADAANRRRLAYLHGAALLKILHARAVETPALWNDIAGLWASVLPGARALDRTLRSNSIWWSDEIAPLRGIRSAAEGEAYCVKFMLPEEVRLHALVQSALRHQVPN